MVDDVQGWVDDPKGDAEWAGEHDGRWGVRVRQSVREATTIWFDVGPRTVGLEAYLLPRPPHESAEVYRICLSRNYRSWPAVIALDDRGDIYVMARVSTSHLRAADLDRGVGAIYETVELSFRPLVRAGFGSREKTR